MAGSSNDSGARRPGGVLSVFRRKPRHLARPAAKRSPVRTTLIALAALRPVVSVLAVTSPASAHANTVSGKVACQADGTWTVTWTVANDYDATVQVTLNDTTGRSAASAMSVPRIGRRLAAGLSWAAGFRPKTLTTPRGRRAHPLFDESAMVCAPHDRGRSHHWLAATVPPSGDR